MIAASLCCLIYTPTLALLSLPYHTVHSIPIGLTAPLCHPLHGSHAIALHVATYHAASYDKDNQSSPKIHDKSEQE